MTGGPVLPAGKGARGGARSRFTEPAGSTGHTGHAEGSMEELAGHGGMALSKPAAAPPIHAEHEAEQELATPELQTRVARGARQWIPDSRWRCEEQEASRYSDLTLRLQHRQHRRPASPCRAPPVLPTTPSGASPPNPASTAAHPLLRRQPPAPFTCFSFSRRAVPSTCPSLAGSAAKPASVMARSRVRGPTRRGSYFTCREGTGGHVKSGNDTGRTLCRLCKPSGVRRQAFRTPS